ERAASHRYFLPLTVAIADVNGCFVRIKTTHGGGDAQVGAATHALISRSHRNALRGQQVGNHPAAQEVAEAVVHQARACDQKIRQHENGGSETNPSGIQYCRFNLSFYWMTVADPQRVFGEQTSKGITFLFQLRVGGDATIEGR